MVRALEDREIAELLAADHVARLSTVDARGYPHVTPLWFLWEDGVFRLASYIGRPHLTRIRANPRVGLLVDTEDALRADGERPNRQVRVIGDATLSAEPRPGGAAESGTSTPPTPRARSPATAC